MSDSSSRPAKRVRSTFNTIERERNFKNPPKDASVVPILNEFVTPHLESFNALFDDSGLPAGDGDGRGLLHLGIDDIGKRVVFDGKGDIGAESGQRGWGNRLSSECSVHSVHPHEMNEFQVWYEQVTVARPMVPERDKDAVERRVFPTEASPHEQTLAHIIPTQSLCINRLANVSHLTEGGWSSSYAGR